MFTKKFSLFIGGFFITLLSTPAHAYEISYCHSPSCTPGAPGYVAPVVPQQEAPVCHSATCAPKPYYFQPVAIEKNTTIRHIVCFKFKEEVSSSEISETVKKFRDLKKQIPYIVSLESGTNNSSEGQTHGFTNCFIVTFHNQENRDYYVTSDPAHQTFKDFVGPLIDQVFVFDFNDGK